MVVAQLTVPTSAVPTTVKLNLQGHAEQRSAEPALYVNQAHYDWKEVGLTFELANSVAPPSSCTGACVGSPCFDGVACAPLAAGGFSCAGCPAGYTGDGVLCEPWATGPPEGCTSWHDGCNTCGVVDGAAAGCTEIACGTTAAPYCKAYADGRECSDATTVRAALGRLSALSGLL